MPILFQHTINKDTQLSVWKIKEPASFFIDALPAVNIPSHPHRRLQHLAGRFLLSHMQPDFPIEKIIAREGEKPFLSDLSQQFSISHSADVAAAIICNNKSVGIDIEIISDKAKRIAPKFLHEDELAFVKTGMDSENYHVTLAWSIKETIFKWYGLGNVDFREDIQIKSLHTGNQEETAVCFFRKTDQILYVNFMRIDDVVLSWLI